MSWLDLNPDDDVQFADAVRQRPAGPSGPAFFRGVLSAPLSGTAAGAAKVVQAGADAQATFIAQAARETGAAPESIAAGFEPSDPYAGLMATPLPDQPIKGTPPDEWEANAKRQTAELVASTKPDPMANGAAAQVLHGVFDVGSRFVAGTAAGGPLAGASLAGGTEGYSAFREAQVAGVDPATAKLLGVTSAGTTFLGSLVPGSFGTYTRSILGGIGVNVGLGGFSRYANSEILAGGGYPDMAEQYKVLDSTALLTDTVLGAVFGGFGHAFHMEPPTFSDRMAAWANRNTELYGQKFTWSDVDAALVANQAAHADVGTAPGIPATLEAREAHAANLAEATAALLEDRDPQGLRPVETAPKPAQEPTRAALSDAATERLAELGEPPVRPGTVLATERRAPELRRTEMDTLREKLTAGTISPEETRRLAELQVADRAQAKVGDAAVPIRGVLSRAGMRDVLASGETFTHQTMLDLNGFKRVNDTLGHDIGDQVIRYIGERLAAHAEPGVRIEHRGGDEFMIHANDPAAGARIADRAGADLSTVRLRALDASGNVVGERTGVSLAHGTGTDEIAADVALRAAKEAQLAAGIRTERGAAAPVAERVAGQPAGEGAGTARASADARRQAAIPGDVAERAPIEDAQALLARLPDLEIDDGAGGKVNAREALSAALDELATAKEDGTLAEVAAACFIGGAA